jgi:hypothetical protein
MRFLSQPWFGAAQQVIAVDPSVKEATATTTLRVQQVVTDGPGGGEIRHFIRIDNGNVGVGLGDVEQPDVTLTASYDTAASLNRGELDPMAAMGEGRLLIEGDVMTLMENQAAVAPLNAAYASLNDRTEY